MAHTIGDASSGYHFADPYDPAREREKRQAAIRAKKQSVRGFGDLVGIQSGTHDLFPLLETGSGRSLRRILQETPDHKHAQPTECKNCHATRWGLFLRDISRSGKTSIVQRCIICGAEMHRLGRKRFGVNVDPDLLPCWDDRRSAMCVRCGDNGSGAEEHHWAPRHVFGWNEADNWPKDPLCVPCHALWHKIVTPGGTRDANLDDGRWEAQRVMPGACQRCQSYSGILIDHPWAPAELFGDEESTWWPTAILCLDCSQKWTTAIMDARKVAA